MQTFADEMVNRLSYDGRVNLIRAILRQPTTDIAQHWGAIWASVWALLAMHPGVFSSKAQAIGLPPAADAQRTASPSPTRSSSTSP